MLIGRGVDYPARVLRRHTRYVAVALLFVALICLTAVIGVSAVGLAAPVDMPSAASIGARDLVRERTARDAAPRSSPAHARKLTATRHPQAYRIAFFGDSVSVGYGASNRHRTYVARVARWLEAHGARVIGTVDAKGGVPVAYWTYAPIPERLDVAVVELGTNDVRLGTPSSRFAYEYRTLTGRIRAAAPKAQVLCLSVWSRAGWASLERALNAQIRAVCPGTYVDITGLRGRPRIRSSDGFHPNDLGYHLIARAVESKLKTP